MTTTTADMHIYLSADEASVVSLALIAARTILTDDERATADRVLRTIASWAPAPTPVIVADVGAPDIEDVIACRISLWVEKLDDIDINHKFSVEVLTKYVKVIQTYRDGSRSVHAFVDPKTGEVFKAEGWKKPAKGVRFNLTEYDSWRKLLDTVDIHGSYLYLK